MSAGGSRDGSHAKIARALLAWYRENARDLPWRRRRDAYGVWVSEVMLQQTRVQTVIPYYERFMARFPTPAALAEAEEEELLAAWSGLGYYRRARLLHAGVREVVARYGGEVPEEAEARRALPGVGRYTAGAIGSIVFGKKEPVVDGNVARVLARVFAIETPLGKAETEARLWEEAGALVRAVRPARGERPGDLNQAVMELGATLCAPKRPACEACPLRASCRARAEGKAASLPIAKAKRKPKEVAMVAVIAERGEGAFLVRSEGSLFGGLFGPPMREGEGGEAAREALREAGVRGRLEADPLAQIEHVLSHRRLRVKVYRARACRAQPGSEARLVRPEELGAIGSSTLARKILGVLHPALGAPRTLLLPGLDPPAKADP